MTDQTALEPTTTEEGSPEDPVNVGIRAPRISIEASQTSPSEMLDYLDRIEEHVRGIRIYALCTFVAITMIGVLYAFFLVSILVDR